jgi:hypothetical protein
MNNHMSMTEAAEILATTVVVYARKWDVARVDVRFYEEVISELRVTAEPGSRLHQAAVLMPAYATVKRAAK